ncbi:MAG: hypothetical protein HC769_28800 [Cyanobacteria bacterium CRU_2_1]|nr:hypothetical protein [Cyanobacteria bacterium RU_5_0]NJR62452.1 hypothetical protein [Cyanobacteria bacterium CRU_2_1]
MFSKIPERHMHITRWVLAIGWLILIASMFYDPISAIVTEPGQTFAAKTANGCYQFQGDCRPLESYPMGARIFWGMVLPLCVVTLLVFGHEAWRRICPLSFFSQIARGLGIQRKRVVTEDSWLHHNALTLQFALLFVGLNVRLLLVNSDRLLLGIFLVLTILFAIVVGFLFDGKTWCHYFCPMAPVHMIYSEPSGLLGSKAHTAPPKSITQSMCRTVDQTGQERSACAACKLACMDIDAERSYWEEINQPNRKLLYYAYVGLVIGFYVYFGLYSGNWNFLSAGVWNETNQLATLLSPGFYINGVAIPIPKLIAVPLTLTFTSGAGYVIGLWAEKHLKRYNKRFKHPLSNDHVQSRIFSVATFIAFNLLFFLGVRPTIGYFPPLIQNLIAWAAVLCSSLWIVKSWNRSAERYARERDGNLLRRQLGKLDIDFSQFLEGRSLEELKPDELYALARVLPSFTSQYRLLMYEGILRDALEQQTVTLEDCQKAFQAMRQKLGINEAAHGEVLAKLQAESPDLFVPRPQQIGTSDPTIRRQYSVLHNDPTTVVSRRSRQPAQHDPTTVVARRTKPPIAHEDPTVVAQRNNPPQDDATIASRQPINPVIQDDPTIVAPRNTIQPEDTKSGEKPPQV